MNIRAESKETEWLIEEVSNSLKRAGFISEVISYPPNQRSIDLVVSLGPENVFLKVVYNTKELTRAEIEDLTKAEKAYNVPTAVVALKENKLDLEDDVMYFKQSAKVLTPKTLEKCLRGEKPIVASIRGNYVLKVNPWKFYHKRIQHGYSRGELARLINVSTKTIYMYEQGSMYVSLEKAIEIATVLGEDVFEEFDLHSQSTATTRIRPSCTPRDKIEELIYSVASRYGREFLNFEKTPIDAVVKGKYVVSIVKSVYGLKEKIENAEKIVNRVRAELVVVKDEKDVSAIKRLLSRNH